MLSLIHSCAVLAAQIAQEPAAGLYNGLIVAAFLGSTINGTIPLALGHLTGTKRFMAFFLYDNPISNKLIVFDTSFVNSFFTCLLYTSHYNGKIPRNPFAMYHVPYGLDQRGTWQTDFSVSCRCSVPP